MRSGLARMLATVRSASRTRGASAARGRRARPRWPKHYSERPRGRAGRCRRPRRARAPELHRGDGEDARAAAVVEHASPRPAPRARASARHEPRRGVAAGAERRARVEHDVHRAGVGRLVPRGHDPQPLARADGLELALRLAHPVGVLELVDDGRLERRRGPLREGRRRARPRRRRRRAAGPPGGSAATRPGRRRARRRSRSRRRCRRRRRSDLGARRAPAASSASASSAGAAAGAPPRPSGARPSSARPQASAWIA